MQEHKTLVMSIAVTAGILVSLVFWGKDYTTEQNADAMEVLPIPSPEEVKEEIEEKVDEVKEIVKETVKEKAEEIKEEVEQLKEMLPEIPAIPELKETPAPTLETPKEDTNDSL